MSGMTDQPITGWRTVATHGQPPTGKWVLIAFDGRHSASRIGVYVHLRNNYDPTTEWIPMSEVAELPDAPPPPPPPRTVTIELSEADARWWAVRKYLPESQTEGLATAAREALARLDAEDPV